MRRIAQQRLDHGAGVTGGDRVEDPTGQPGALEDLGEGEHRQRRLLGGLDDDGAAGGERGGELAGAHRHREVPGGDEHAGPDGLAHREDAAFAGGVGHVAAVDADGLLGEPAEELGGVGDLGLGLGERLAHLQRHQQRELVIARGELLVGAAQDLAALARGVRGPLGLARGGGGERVEGVLRLGVGDLAQRLAGGGVLDGQRATAGCGAPVAGDVELGRGPGRALPARRSRVSSRDSLPGLVLVGIVVACEAHARAKFGRSKAYGIPRPQIGARRARGQRRGDLPAMRPSYHRLAPPRPPGARPPRRARWPLPSRARHGSPPPSPRRRSPACSPACCAQHSRRRARPRRPRRS